MMQEFSSKSRLLSTLGRVPAAYGSLGRRHTTSMRTAV